MICQITDWSPGAIEFDALLGHHLPRCFPAAALIQSYLYLDEPLLNHFVPTEGRERFRISLWLSNAGPGGSPPPQMAGGQPVEVIISDVIYVPEPNACLSSLIGIAVLATSSRRRN